MPTSRSNKTHNFSDSSHPSYVLLAREKQLLPHLFVLSVGLFNKSARTDYITFFFFFRVPAVFIGALVGWCVCFVCRSYCLGGEASTNSRLTHGTTAIRVKPLLTARLVVLVVAYAHRTNVRVSTRAPMNQTFTQANLHNVNTTHNNTTT